MLFFIFHSWKHEINQLPTGIPFIIIGLTDTQSMATYNASYDKESLSNPPQFPYMQYSCKGE